MNNDLSMFTPEEIELLENFVELNTKLKALESSKKIMVEKVKGILMNLNITNCNIAGSSLSIVESERRTVSKATKDKFVAELISLGKNYLVTTSIEPDIDSILSESNAGLIDKDMVNKYIKVSPVVTLRCN